MSLPVWLDWRHCCVHKCFCVCIPNMVKHYVFKNIQLISAKLTAAMHYGTGEYHHIGARRSKFKVTVP